MQPIAFDLFCFLRKSLLLQAGTTQKSLGTKRSRPRESTSKAHPFLAERYVTNVFDVADVQLAYETASVPAAGRLKVGLKLA